MPSQPKRTQSQKPTCREHRLGTMPLRKGLRPANIQQLRSRQWSLRPRSRQQQLPRQPVDEVVAKAVGVAVVNLFRRLQAVARQPMLRIPALRQRQRLRLLNQQQQQHNQASLPQSAVASASRRASNWGVPSVTGAKWDALLAGRKLV